MGGIWGLPLGVIVIGLFAATLAGHEFGMRAHDWLKGRGADDRKGGSSDEGFILSGVLGLLALLMAFSFSMSLDRFETRRDLMLRETSALGNLDLVSKAARSPLAAEIAPLLQRYADARLKVVMLADGPERARAAEAAIGLRTQLHDAVERTLGAEAGQPTAVALAGAYDELEDSGVRRDAMAAAHLPGLVLGLLAIYCIFSAAMLGYALAAGRSRHRAASTTFYLLLSLAFGTILDLDRPRSGAITVPQEPFAEAVRTLRK